jgi:cob(I)alamin adenosyltransferase
MFHGEAGMVRLNRITTGTGDRGTTSLADGTRVAKTHPRVVAYGTVDELNCLLGVARTEEVPPAVGAELAHLQHDLFDLGADLATPPAGAAEAHLPRLREDQVRHLEALTAAATARLAPADSFVLPGGSRAAACLHLARAVARRAEREVWSLLQSEPEGAVNPLCLTYLNRLSDLLFVWARLANDEGRGDVLWRPYHER